MSSAASSMAPSQRELQSVLQRMLRDHEFGDSSGEAARDAATHLMPSPHQIGRQFQQQHQHMSVSVGHPVNHNSHHQQHYQQQQQQQQAHEQDSMKQKRDRQGPRRGQSKSSGYDAGGSYNASVQSMDASREDEVLTRTVHVRFLPTTLPQGDFAHLCMSCGEVLRIRICGNNIPSGDQSWIYGFVEFADASGANNLVKKSGTTLGHNGKSSLRMKATLAKQPINDRVYHDADTAKGTPCTFGQGQYASITLKEAVEHYFNIVTKNTVAKSLNFVRSLTASAAENNNTNAPQQTSLSSKFQSQHSNTQHQQSRQSSGSDSDDMQSVTPTTHTPSLMSCESPPPSLTASSILGATKQQQYINPQQQQHAAVNGNLMSSSSAFLHFSGSSSVPSNTIGGPSSRPIPKVSMSSRMAQAAPLVADEFVLQRCYTLLETGMRHGKIFAQSKIQTSFFDGIASVRSLQEALEKHGPFRNYLASICPSFAQQQQQSAAACDSSSSITTIVPSSANTSLFNVKIGNPHTQQSPSSLFDTVTSTSCSPPLRPAIARSVTEIFIAMNVIGLQLHALRGTLADLVPFANSIVDVCLSSPCKALASAMPREENKSSKISQDKGSNADDEKFEDDDDDINFIMKVVADAGAYDTAEAEHDRQTRVKHQVFLCQSLIAVGLTVEASNPLMARCVYNMANLRMTQTLNTSLPMLQNALFGATSVSLFKTISSSSSTNFGSFSEQFFVTFVAGSVDANATASSSSSLSASSIVPSGSSQMMKGQPPQGSETMHAAGRLPPSHCSVQIPFRR